MFIIQNRHQLSVRRSCSEKDMTHQMYINARPSYLAKERKFRREIGVIVQRPEDYDDFHEEIWEEGLTEVWDAKREFNLDEVPFMLDINTKQILSDNERACVLKKPLRYQGKYRQGTLVLITNFERIFLIVVVYARGGKGVAKKLEKQMEGTKTQKVMWFCTQSGSVTARVWGKIMNVFKNLTKVLRGCEKQTATDWRKAIVLNVDNYGVHLEKKLAQKWASLYGIFLRCLLRNASHIQQPIDQHIGETVKKIIKGKLEKWIGSANRYNSYGVEVALSKQKWRQVLARFVLEASREIEADANKHMLALSWQNYGLYLPLNGSLDKEISTLHKDSLKVRSPAWKENRRKELIKLVTISTRKQGFICREYEALHPIYSIEEADRNSRVSTVKKTPQRYHLENDLRESNQRALNKFATDFSRDLTDLRNEFPDLSQVITPYDVMTLKTLFEKHGQSELIKSILLEKLNIPLRNEAGKIICMPRRSSISDMSTMMDVEDEIESAHKTQFVLQILDEV